MRAQLLDVTPLRTSPQFRRLWIGRTCSVLGAQLTLVAVLFQVWERTGSTVWTGAVGLARAVPIVVFGLFAGSLVDRVDRRRFYLVTTVAQAACSVLLVAQSAVPGFPVGGVLGILAVQSCFVAGAGPASRTFIPRLLPREQVAAGLALNRISFQGCMLLGPAIGGVLIGWAGVTGCYAVDAVTFGCAFYGAFGLPAMQPGDSARPGLRGISDGLAFLVRTPAVRGALLTDLAAMVLSMPMSLFPLVNAERFGGNPRTLGLFLTAIAVGGVAASVFSGVFTRLPRPGVVMLAGSAAWGLALTLFGLTTNPCWAWVSWRWRVRRTRCRWFRGARWFSCTRPTSCSAASLPRSRSSDRRGRISATCAPDWWRRRRRRWRHSSAAGCCAWPRSRPSP
ncbi:MFS transporter [Amycolatopsis sp. CA-161197]|uniref:MFS transporter n=1 Tax=Amycolatopsis sp. CA-161197 TaxID=3239922 RepID=UPI003D920A7E